MPSPNGQMCGQFLKTVWNMTSFWDTRTTWFLSVAEHLFRFSLCCLSLIVHCYCLVLFSLLWVALWLMSLGLCLFQSIRRSSRLLRAPTTAKLIFIQKGNWNRSSMKSAGLEIRKCFSVAKTSWCCQQGCLASNIPVLCIFSAIPRLKCLLWVSVPVFAFIWTNWSQFEPRLLSTILSITLSIALDCFFAGLFAIRWFLTFFRLFCFQQMMPPATTWQANSLLFSSVLRVTSHFWGWEFLRSAREFPKHACNRLTIACYRLRLRQECVRCA